MPYKLRKILHYAARVVISVLSWFILTVISLLTVAAFHPGEGAVELNTIAPFFIPFAIAVGIFFISKKPLNSSKFFCNPDGLISDQLISDPKTVVCTPPPPKESSRTSELDKQLHEKTITSAVHLDTDLVIMDAHGAVCSECAKYQGRVYSISGKSKVFPKVPRFFHSSRCVHPGCCHAFWPYIHGVNDPDLAYTLAVHPLKDPRYGTDIITFSNRPFVDDRTDECKAAAEEVLHGETREEKYMREFEERMKELEAKREQEEQDYYWLCMNFPDKCPKSVTGYRRMKTQNTKNFQILKALATEHGRKI